MTTIDPSKVHLQEVDIEDWLYANPQAVRLGYSATIDKWIARQLKVSSGIIDLVGIVTMGRGPMTYLIVVEIKNTDVGSDALTQVSRYAADLDRMLGVSEFFQDYTYWGIIRAIVGPSISDRVFTEAMALEIRYLQFNVELSLDVSSVTWTEEYLNGRRLNDLRASESEWFSQFSDIVKERGDEFRQRQKQYYEEQETQYEEASELEVESE